MNIDYQVLFNFATVIVGTLGGWVLGRITKALDSLDAEIRAVSSTYVTKADYRSDMGEIKASLLRIESKLDGKVDK